MKITNYNNNTKELVENYIKENRIVITSEILKLGKQKRVINFESAKKILNDLEHEGKIRIRRVGMRVIIYEWTGEDDNATV